MAGERSDATPPPPTSAPKCGVGREQVEQSLSNELGYLPETRSPQAQQSPRHGAQAMARCRATIPPDRLRHCTDDQPAPRIRSARAAWSGQARIDSAR